MWGSGEGVAGEGVGPCMCAKHDWLSDSGKETVGSPVEDAHCPPPNVTECNFVTRNLPTLAPATLRAAFG